MSNFAKVENGLVTQVIAIEQDELNKGHWGDPASWVQSSDNNPDGLPLRKNHAGIGYTYDSQRDAFLRPKLYPSWVLNEETYLWDPPVPFPSDIGTPENPRGYIWDETTISWTELDLT